MLNIKIESFDANKNTNVTKILTVIYSKYQELPAFSQVYPSEL